MSQILIVSNEKSTSGILTTLLKTEGYKVTRAGDIGRALELVETDQFNLMIMGCSKGWDPDLSIIQSAQRAQAAMPVIAIIDENDSETAARLGTLSIFATIEKPLKVDKLLLEVQKAVDYNDEALAKAASVNIQLETLYQYEGIIAESPAMKSVCDIIDRIAGIDVAVLIKGNSGVGKGAIARAIHANSSRSAKEMLVLECSNESIADKLFGSEGNDNCFKKAAKGTLFFKNIHRLSSPLQKKLAAALAEREIAVGSGEEPTPLTSRIISSTVEDLDAAVSKGIFNEDLLKQIKTIVIKVPSLKERPQDIPATIKSVMRNVQSETKKMSTITPEAMEKLQQHSWPGNISEIRLVLTSAIQSAGESGITVESLPAEIRH